MMYLIIILTFHAAFLYQQYEFLLVLTLQFYVLLVWVAVKYILYLSIVEGCILQSQLGHISILINCLYTEYIYNYNLFLKNVYLFK